MGDLTASQWGMVTTAQATARGIRRLQVARLAAGELLERVGHGVYPALQTAVEAEPAVTPTAG
ncbi:MAG: type IV toxin-antitoxin system AbiEi family antitoxin domain-containing protein [Bifidobacteriaceae bacterium]|nr:type IV toxin-antitoxin system AbiEi family antitoxin domain-containing protein [Bifidobacteriaceae bacterium]